MKDALNKNRKARLNEIARYVSGSETQVDYVDVSRIFEISPMQARNDLTFLIRKDVVPVANVLFEDGGVNFNGDPIIRHKRKNPKKTGRKKYLGGS